jgi:Tfp pilus assembly protein PilF
MRIGLLLAVSLWLSACAMAPQSREDSVLNDRLFAPASERIDAADVFAVSDEMRRYLSVEIVEQLDRKGRQKGLFDALYSKNQLKIDYDASLTRNAAETFAARSGNCLSLVVMTAALAKELGLSVRYQRLFVDDSWSRAGGIYFSSGHVNITLGRKHGDPRALFTERMPLTIDFLPLAGVHEQHAWDLTEQTIVAMFMNNRAAEALSRGKLDDAYWWAREALAQDAKYLAAYNTLGVVYRRHGDARQAERAFKAVLEHEPANLHAMSNLALIYEDEGRTAEAKALEKKVEIAQPFPPFHFFNLGQAAMREGHFLAARDFFRKELERDSGYHEFHFWLALAHFALGEMPEARAHMATAMRNSTTRTEHDLYAAKLDRIDSKQH